MPNRYKATINASFVAYIVQAIVNNFAPLLFLTFQTTYSIPLSQITLLVTINFTVQLLVDFFSIFFVDKIGYRPCMLLAHASAVVGLVCLTILPGLLPSAFTGLLISVIIYAIGGGLLEVLVSPIVEACPTDNKEKAMSLLHSFYCWGHVAVVLLSTLFFFLFGIQNWRILALLWAVIPLVNLFAFARVPIATMQEEEGTASLPVTALLRQKFFWIFLIMMICAGASEQSVSQWVSTFAESGLQVSKTVGDLTGTMCFAIAMGLSRAFFGKFGEKLNLDKFMAGSALLCIAAYLAISLINIPAVALLGCALCGLSVGIFWPGTFSKASAKIRGGGTAMFALLALGGDIGCAGGPTLVGLISGAFGDNLRFGILCAIVFPVLLLVGIRMSRNGKKQAQGQ